MLIYLDSNIVIYLIEQTPNWGPRASARLTTAIANQDQFVVSDITRLECRVGPLIAGDYPRLGRFDLFFGQAGLRVVGITRAVVDRATLVRADHGFRLGDSLHLAAAVEAGCDVFLTNDTRLSAFADITVEVLP